MIDGTRTPEQLARAVTDEFEVNNATALADTYAFLDELERNGMLAEAMPPGIRKKAGLDLRSTSVDLQEPSD